MPLIFVSQCPICGRSNGSGRSLGSHYRTVHPEFFTQYRLLNGGFLRLSFALFFIWLVSLSLLVVGLSQLAVLVWGLQLVSWFAYTLLFFQRKFDEVSDRFLDEWRKEGKPTSIGEVVASSATTGGTPLLCPICKEGSFRLGLGMRYHIRINHPDYFSWYAKWVRTIESATMLIALVLLSLVVTGLLPLNSTTGSITLFGTVFSIVLVFAGNRSRKERGWRKNWTEHHHSMGRPGPGF